MGCVASSTQKPPVSIVPAPAPTLIPKDTSPQAARKMSTMTADEIAAKQQLYDNVTSDPAMQEKIDAIFGALDVNGDGKLEADELKDLVSAYDGRPFDEKAFFQFYVR